MKEIVIISGKGGTGKTSIAASFAALAAGKAVLADCDVDAADLHLILKPEIRKRTLFYGGHKAEIRADDCAGCGICAGVCRFDAVRECPAGDGGRQKIYSIDTVACEGCGVCVRFCPVKAIDFPEEACGEWLVSDTRFGTMVHARLGIAAENSGKLVTLVRNEAKRISAESGAEYLLIDGSPGIGCPVIASLTGADLAVIVTEPTVSGDHDMRRIIDLIRRLGVPGVVCVNKWDINPVKAEMIVEQAGSMGVFHAGNIRYDKSVTKAQIAGRAVAEYCGEGAAGDIKDLWQKIVTM